jgi:sialidase-1
VSSVIAAEPEMTDTHIFLHSTAKNKEGKDIKTFYRIPSIVTAKDGAILAFCNGRVGSPRDGCPYQTIVLRRSKDNGKTWEPMQTLVDRPGWICYMGAAVVDDATGHIFMDFNPFPVTKKAKDAYLATRPAEEQARYKEGKWKILPTESRGMLVSKDNGAAWESWKIGKDYQVKPNVSGHLASGCGSDAGFTLRYGPKKGRILYIGRGAGPALTADGKPMKDKDGKPKLVGRNQVVYSDDHGKTWLSGGYVNPGTGEGSIVELPDGSLYANSRTNGPRAEARSFDGGQTFDFKSFKISDTLRDMLGGTAAALLGIPKEAWGRHVVLFSNQSFYKKGNTRWNLWHRKEMKISLSVDGCKTWPVQKLIYKGPAGYSSSTLAKNGNVVILYEKGQGHYRDKGLSVAVFNKEWLLDGKDIKGIK